MIPGRIAVIALAAFLVNALLTPVILAVSHRFNWYDDLDHRKIHSEDTPRLGGVGIFVSFVSVSTVSILVLLPAARIQAWGGFSLPMMLGGLATIHALGVYDDFINLRAPFKFLIQVLAGTLVALSGATLQQLVLPVVGTVMLPVWIALPATVLWIVSISNAVNLIDGSDGLAGGVCLIAALFLGMISFGQGGLMPAVFAFALAGSIAGFLLFNFPPAQLFMGDGGSLTLGFVLAVIPMLGMHGNSSPPMAVPVIPVLTLLYLPIMDTLLAIVRRSKRGLPVHSPDREHIHHRLIDRGFQGRSLLAVVYSGMIIFGFTAMAGYAFSDTATVVVTLSVWVIALATIVRLGHHGET